MARRYNLTVDLLDGNLAERADRVAVLDDRGPTTYGALAERANRAGNALLALGARPEERVALVLLDTVDFHAAFLGAAKAGLVPVPLNTLLTPEDYTHLLQDCRARVALVSDALLPRLAPALAASPFLQAVVVVDSPLGGDTDGHARWEDLLAAASPTLEAWPTVEDDAAFWLYSSGSTGKPKAAVHRHASPRYTAETYGREVLGLRPDDVVFSAAKLFFAYGLGNALTFPLAVGATAVLRAGRPTPELVLDVLQKERPTVFFGVPTLYASILATGHTPLTAQRLAVSAGEALPAHVGERWRERFGVHVLDGIGSTELLHIFLSNRPGDVHYGTTGRPVPGYELRLLDEEGQPVPDGVEGQLWVRGESACSGYHNDRSRSLQTFHGPWTRTGDCYVREDGLWTCRGRADDMLKVGGIWVSPYEVEAALSAHPMVLEAAVIGRADADGLIKPHAHVVLHDPADASPAMVEDLQRWVKATLAPYKYPRWISFLEALPKTATGKIQRFALRASA